MWHRVVSQFFGRWKFVRTPTWWEQQHHNPRSLSIMLILPHRWANQFPLTSSTCSLCVPASHMSWWLDSNPYCLKNWNEYAFQQRLRDRARKREPERSAKITLLPLTSFISMCTCLPHHGRPLESQSKFVCLPSEIQLWQTRPNSWLVNRSQWNKEMRTW